MTAIILAAGVGKRLLGRSNGRPKCLIEIGGKTLVMRLLEGLAAAGVGEAVVVTGFEGDAVREAVGAGPGGIRVRFLVNPRFREGAILSLWTAREALDGPVLVMDADVLCGRDLIARLVRSPHRSCFLLDATVETTGEEQMLLVNGGRVRNIVRGGAPGYELTGESVGFLKLSAGGARVLRELLELRVAAGHTGIEHEEVYPELLERVEVGYRADRRHALDGDRLPEDVTRAEAESCRASSGDEPRPSARRSSCQGGRPAPSGRAGAAARTDAARAQKGGVERCTLVGGLRRQPIRASAWRSRPRPRSARPPTAGSGSCSAPTRSSTRRWSRSSRRAPVPAQ
jgi:choline kinase